MQHNAANKTAAAATSFTIPALGLKLGSTKLTNSSNAVLIASALSIKPKQIKHANHSFAFILKNQPASKTKIITME